MEKNKKLTTCQVCQKQFLWEPICDKCRYQDIHHQRKVPQGACQQCLEKNLKLTKIGSGKYYCPDCLAWNEEAAKAGIGSYCRRFVDTYCDNCGECVSCLKRKDLTIFSTRDLMLEVMERADFEALLSWEDDGFKQRYGEIMWELEEVKNLSPEKIQELVNNDIFKKKFSQRKFSRGT